MKSNHLVLLVIAALAAALGWIATTSLTGRDQRAPSLSDTPRAVRPVAGVLDGATDSATTPRAGVAALSLDVAATAEDSRGPRVRGSVTAQDGSPLAGAHVTIDRVHDGLRVPLGAASSAADGTYTCSFPLETLGGEPFALVAAAGSHGFQPQRLERTFAPLSEPELVLDFVLEPGGEITGRVVDGDGHPRGGAEVALVVRANAPGGPRPNVARRGESRADGTFQLGFLSSGEYELHARLDATGSALASGLALETGTALEHGDLLLSGPGVLSGHALFPSSAPLAGLELWAVPEDLVAIKNAVPRARTGTLERERGAGLTAGSTHTDSSGAFRFTGLEHGRYVLLVEDPDVRILPQRGLFETGDEAIELTIDTHRLRVAVVDSEGRPFVGATVTVTQMSRRGTSELVPGRTRRLDTGRDGMLSFDVVPETPFAVRVRADGHHAADQLVQLEAGRRQLELEVVLANRVSGGFVRLDVRACDGEPVPSWRVWVLAESTQLALPGFDGVAPADDGTLGPLSVGRYGLVVWPRSEGGMDFPVETSTPIEVFDGRETLVPLTLPRGGRVRLTLELPAGVSIDDELPAESDTWGEITLRRRAQRHLREHGAQASLVTENGDERVLHFDSSGGLELVMLPGATALVHDILQPGRYTLRIEAPGFAPLEQPLQVRAGEVVEAVARLLVGSDMR